MKLLLYCTKSKPYLYKTEKPMIEKMFADYHTQLNKAVLNENLNGKIVAECDFEVEEINYFNDDFGESELYTETLNIEELVRRSCVGINDLYYYLQNKYFQYEGYAIHIKNLHIFDKPKELSEYYTNRIYTKIEDVYTDEIQKNGSEWVRPIKKAPQNMMYAQEVVPFKEEHLIKGVLQEFRGNRVNEYILISIQPQWMCKILNGEKTIEVRKKVLKEMVELI